MAATSSRVTVTSAATRLDTSTAGGMSTSALLIRNRGASAVDLGGPTVVSGAGFQLDPGESATVDLAAVDAGLYGITASGTSSCHVLQVGR